jgi:hypothetical protein
MIQKIPAQRDKPQKLSATQPFIFGWIPTFVGMTV